MNSVDSPVVIVTGASRGIGKQTSLILAEKGARLCLVARNEAGLLAVQDEIASLGGVAVCQVADLARKDDGRKVVETALARLGRIDALVNNAGVLGPMARTQEADPDAWLDCIRVNLWGPFNLCRLCLPHLRKTRGRIVNVSSGAAAHPIYGAGAYCASKAALNLFTAVMATEEPDVACVAVRPGMVDTDMQDRLRGAAQKIMPPDQAGFYVAQKQENRLLSPDTPAQGIANLALLAPLSLSGRFVSFDDPGALPDGFAPAG